MSETISAEDFKALHGAKDRSTVVYSMPKDDRAARLRGHLRAMGAYYDIPKERTESYIKALDEYAPSDTIAEELECFADTVGIPEGPASFYIRQQQLSEKI